MNLNKRMHTLCTPPTQKMTNNARNGGSTLTALSFESVEARGMALSLATWISLQSWQQCSGSNGNYTVVVSVVEKCTVNVGSIGGDSECAVNIGSDGNCTGITCKR